MHAELVETKDKRTHATCAHPPSAHNTGINICMSFSTLNAEIALRDSAGSLGPALDATDRKEMLVFLLAV